MKPNEYLKVILSNQSLADGSGEIKRLSEERTAVEEVLRGKYGQGPVIRYGGSKAKGTMIKESYDLDIICYFKQNDETPGKNLEEIYNNAKKCLEAKYFVQPKTSALRLMAMKERVDFHIDVVPGRFVDASEGDAFLYQAGGQEKRLKTNIDIHVAHIKKSDAIDEIKLAKLWNIRCGLRVKTFVLELLVVKALKGSQVKDIADRMVNLWEYLRDNASRMSVEDPANPTGNDLSSALDGSMKAVLASAATRTLTSIKQQGWESVFGPVVEPSDQDRTAAIEVVASSRPAGPKLWCPNV